jgi:hypothetical protein
MMHFQTIVFPDWDVGFAFGFMIGMIFMLLLVAVYLNLKSNWQFRQKGLEAF